MLPSSPVRPLPIISPNHHHQRPMASSAVSKFQSRTLDSAVLTDSDDSDHNNNNHHHDNNTDSRRKQRHSQQQQQQQQQHDGSMQCDSNPAVDDSDNILDVDYDLDDLDIDDDDDDSLVDDDSDEFRLTIPSVLLGETLASMDQDVLRESLEPVVQSLRQLDAAALLHLHQVEHGARLCDGYVKT